MFTQPSYGFTPPPGTAATGSGATATLIAVGSYTHSAAAGSQVVPVTGMTATSKVFIQIAQNDATFVSGQVVAATNQFTVFANAAPTANATVNYQVYL